MPVLSQPFKPFHGIVILSEVQRGILRRTESKDLRFVDAAIILPGKSKPQILRLRFAPLRMTTLGGTGSLSKR